MSIFCIQSSSDFRFCEIWQINEWLLFLIGTFLLVSRSSSYKQLIPTSSVLFSGLVYCSVRYLGGPLFHQGMNWSGGEGGENKKGNFSCHGVRIGGCQSRERDQDGWARWAWKVWGAWEIGWMGWGILWTGPKGLVTEIIQSHRWLVDWYWLRRGCKRLGGWVFR